MTHQRIVILTILLLVCSAALSQEGIVWSTFHAAGHSKSNGVDLTIKYPANWNAREGTRPHITQKFISPDGLAFAIIVIQDLGQSVSQSEIADFFQPSELKGMVPDGMQYLNAQSTQLEAMPAGILEYRTIMQRVGASVDLQVWSVIVVYERSMIQFQFTVGGLSNEVDTASLMKTYRPIFQQMANSVVFPGKWQNPASAAVPASSTRSVSQVGSLPANSGQSNENLGVNLIVSLIITWGIGLALPLAIRYGIMRRPIGKGAAIGVAAMFCFFNIVLFTALGSESKTHAALMLVAFVSYAILRKGTEEARVNKMEPTR